MRSLWQGKTYLSNASSLLDRDWVNKWGLDLSKEVLWVSLCQRAAKLQAVKVGGWSYCPGIEPGLRSCGPRWAAWQDFFQISNFDSLYFCRPLIYRDPQYLFGKIKTSPVDKKSVQKTSSIFRIGFAWSKWPHFNSAYELGVLIVSSATVNGLKKIIFHIN